MRISAALAIAVACSFTVTAAPARAAEPARILVFDFVAEGFTDGEVRVIEERVARGLSPAGDVMASKDIQRLLEIEGQRQALECESGGESCLAEIAGAMGARYVVTGTLGRMGSLLLCNITLFDAQASRSILRESVEAEDPKDLLRRVDEAVVRLRAPMGGSESASVAASAPVDAGAGVSPWIITGGAVAGLGLAAALVGAGGALVMNGVAADTSRPAQERLDAKPTGQTMIIVGAGGAATFLVGAGLLGLGLLE